jgi:hypothetical protein
VIHQQLLYSFLRKRKLRKFHFYWLFCLLPMFQALQAVDANFLDSVAYGAFPSPDNDLSCFPVDQWAFEEIRPRIRTPTPNYPRKTCFKKTRFLLVASRPMDFRENPTSDSNSPPLITPEKHVLKKLDFYWFPVDQ